MPRSKTMAGAPDGLMVFVHHTDAATLPRALKWCRSGSC